MRRPLGIKLSIGLAAVALGAGLGCSGKPAPPANTVQVLLPPANAPAPTASAAASPEDTTCPPRLADVPGGARLPALLVSAIGANELEKWVAFEVVENMGDDGRAPGGWLSWSSGGNMEIDLVNDPDSLRRRLQSVTGKEARPMPPAPRSKAILAEAQWGDGANRYRMTMTGYPGSQGVDVDYACLAIPAAKPITISEARNLLPALVPERTPNLVLELLANKSIGSIQARTGYEHGGEVSFEVVEGAAWKNAIEKRLAAESDSQIKFTVGDVPGVSYLSDEHGWKIDVFEVPEKKRLHVEADWER